MIKLFIGAALLVGAIVIAAPAQTPAADRVQVLATCDRIFGRSVDLNENLFEVNEQFVVRPKFDSVGRLRAIQVFPKYWREESHPDWTEPRGGWPLLSKDEYKTWLSVIARIRPFGPLTKRGSGSVITNSTSYILDEYRDAYVERGDNFGGYRFFEVYYFHVVEGEIASKRIIRDDNGQPGAYSVGLVIVSTRFGKANLPNMRLENSQRSPA